MKSNIIFPVKYRLFSVSLTVAFGATLLPFPCMSQSYGPGAITDPLAPGYVYRASKMLSGGNPLGAVDQTSASACDLDALSPELRVQWLAAEGSALFERGDASCIAVLQQLADLYPTDASATQALLTIGDWYWYHADWHKALEYYGKTDIENLAPEQKHLYTYRKALAYLKCGLPELATPLFDSIATERDYAKAAKYYKAYISYLNRDYDTAYTLMKEVADEGATDGMTPAYYMAQIEYIRGKYDDVIKQAEALMTKNQVEELLPELHRLTGLSYFKKGIYDTARPLLEKFVAETDYPDDDAVYALGAIRYEDGDLEGAEALLKDLTDRNNDLAQGAYLYLGQISEQRGDLNAAAMEFGKAATMAYDRDVAETALYNRITALTKGGNAPFASNITILEGFLSEYPNSRYASDVQESLAAAYFYDNDYSRALASINKVKHPSAATLLTKQKILYRLGMSEVARGSFQQGASHLREAADMRTSDGALTAESRLWLGEALYGQGDFKGAVSAYSTSLQGKLTEENKRAARYGLAYAQFKLGNWKEAQKNFAGVAEDRTAPEAMRGDALVREADCRFYSGDYTGASAQYQRVAREGKGDADYAIFRNAVVTGLLEGTDAKMKKLNAFLNDKPNSKWTPEVLLEAGNTMASLDRPDKAAPYFERLSREYPKDNKSRAGVLALASAYMKQGETEKAKSAYKEIIKTWPTSDEASISNDEMRRITAGDGTLIDYASFLASIDGAPKIDPDEMDAITFEAAETAYATDATKTAQLEQYVKDYPDGRYLANALMDLAEAADGKGETTKALSYLDKLLSQRGDSPLAGAALYLKADLLESKGDKPRALATYQALEERGGVDFAPEATAGVMRTTGDSSQRTEYARRLLAMGGVSAEDAEDARFYEASGILHSNQSGAGEEALKKLAANPNNLSGAKSAVELGEWYLAKGNVKKALSTLEAFTDAGSVHAYWLARGFISLADAYHADGNDYLAVEYLKSLRDNYPGDEQDIAEAIASKIKKYSKKK